jgi:hypothetical protein
VAVFNASATLTSAALLCFTTAPRRVVLQPGEQLFRFGSIVGPGFQGNEIFGSPWWIPASAFRTITLTAHRTGQPIGAVARSRLAIAPAWNPDMDWLIVLELTLPVSAWIGPAKPQPLSSESRQVMMLGNFDQAYVPGLAPPGAMSSEAGRLAYCGSAWAI